MGGKWRLLAAVWLGGCGIFEPAPRGGLVVAPDGAPLPGVVVAAGDASAVTGADGRWALATRDWSATFRKPGYLAQDAHLPADSITLQPGQEALRAAWDERWAGPPLDGAKAWLDGQGIDVVVVSSGTLPTAEVIVLAAPSFYSNAALGETLAAVRNGATLLLAGEWGGFSRVDMAALDNLGAPAGIRFSGSVVRDPAAGMLPDRLVPEFLIPSLPASGSVQFASAGALSAVPPAAILARTGEASYRVSMWKRGPQIVAAYGPLGKGKVVAVSDASWLTDDRTLDPAKPNWQVAGNAALALALVRF